MLWFFLSGISSRWLLLIKFISGVDLPRREVAGSNGTDSTPSASSIVPVPERGPSVAVRCHVPNTPIGFVMRSVSL